jgi:mRNA interferase RelE/StbE
MYSLSIQRSAIKDLATIQKDYATLIGSHIDSLAQTPRPLDAKKLKGDAGYSLRVGVYRVLYDIDDGEQKVTIYRVKHRREAYR